MTAAQRAPSQARKQGCETGRPSPAERGRGPAAAALFRTPAAVAAAGASPSPVGSLQNMIWLASSSRSRGRDGFRSSCRHREGVGGVVERLAAAAMGGELRGTHRYAARGASPDGPQSRTLVTDHSHGPQSRILYYAPIRSKGSKPRRTLIICWLVPLYPLQ